MPQACRILILNERDPRHPAAGGAEVHIAEISRRMAAMGYRVTQAAVGFPGAPQREELDGLEVIRLGRIRWYYPSAAALCARETRRGRFDLVVEHLNKLPFCSPAYSAVPVLAVDHPPFGPSAFLQGAWPGAAAVGGPAPPVGPSETCSGAGWGRSARGVSVGSAIRCSANRAASRATSSSPPSSERPSSP